jgi:hypothetical protein
MPAWWLVVPMPHRNEAARSIEVDGYEMQRHARSLALGRGCTLARPSGAPRPRPVLKRGRGTRSVSVRPGRSWDAVGRRDDLVMAGPTA